MPFYFMIILDNLNESSDIITLDIRQMIPKPNFEFKFVLVGDSSVGKSSLLTRFVDDQFNESLLSTIGVDFKFRRFNINPYNVKIQIWDTAGQETFRSLVSAYYHSADAILIVYDLTVQESFQSIMQYWIKEAQNNNRNNALIFLIGNKSDQKDNSKDTQTESIAAMVDKHRVSKNFQMSAKTGENVEESFKEICRMLISKRGGEAEIGRTTNPTLKTNGDNQAGGKKKCC